MNKKIIAGVLSVLLIGGGVPCCNYLTQPTAIVANAETTVVPVDKIYYESFDDYVQIKSLNNINLSAELEFPSYIDGKPVEVIGNGSSVFHYSNSVKKVKIPSTVKTIEANAFKSCYNAESIEIPASVTSIGDYAFSGCASLLSVSIPTSGDELTIGDGAFIGCAKLTRVNLPDRITSMGRGCFTGCSNLTNIILPNGIVNLKTLSTSGSITATNASGQSVDYGAEIGFFEKCSKLGSIIIPDSVQNIDEKTFKGCDSLSEITIGAGIEALGTIDLSSTALKKINVSEENPVYSSKDGILFDKPMSRLIRYPVSCETVKYVIPSTVTDVDKNAFEGSKNLTYIVFPESVSEIPQGMFDNCGSLKKIMILNRECTIEAEISPDIEIAGYKGSTTENHAVQMGYTFIDIEAQNEPVPTPSTDFKEGDVNRDGLVDAVDASCILSYYAYLSTGGDASVTIYEYITTSETAE
ncbi:MAG: leucine-rich repeat protein [Ruminococcus flavefaciens]|nr:leucine-rich repeat protein [Ruminococcus flavefaciens]MCM1228893.1 leucine-rich repeat protein [Ruminococcus flavefaciens]